LHRQGGDVVQDVQDSAAAVASAADAMAVTGASPGRDARAASDPALVERLRGKSLAICSGKGGVGKTVTAANLSVYYARKGLRVGLIDLDPLSDTATLLDLQDSESVLIRPDPTVDEPEEQGGRFDAQVLAAFPQLDLLFPAPKLDRSESRGLLQKIYHQYPAELDRRYDILIFDLPAGSDLEENLAFLPFMKVLILVTNPEPTAHAAAGAYVRRALEVHPGAVFQVWHNRYSGGRPDGFDPADLVGNYNRNVPEELRLSPENGRHLKDFCFMPEDPSLNLLKGEPDVLLNLMHRMAEIVRLIHAGRLREIAGRQKLSRRSFDFVHYFLERNRRIEPLDSYLEELERFLLQLLRGSRTGEAVFGPEERELLRGFLQAVQDDPLCASILRLLDLLEERIRQLQGSRRLFAAAAGSPADRAIDREVSRFLLELPGPAAGNAELRNFGGLLLLYFSLFKLLQSPSIARLFHSLIPRKKDRRGRMVRDRQRQILSLLEKEGAQHKEFLRLIRTLYPILIRQISGIARVFRLGGLVFRDDRRAVHRKAYLSLLTHFTHDTLYSGLSIVVGFAYRPASAAFQRSAERILRLLAVSGGSPPRPPLAAPPAVESSRPQP
jgi:flagellar biosynthesis protein FlhG